MTWRWLGQREDLLLFCHFESRFGIQKFWDGTGVKYSQKYSWVHDHKSSQLADILMPIIFVFNWTTEGKSSRRAPCGMVGHGRDWWSMYTSSQPRKLKAARDDGQVFYPKNSEKSPKNRFSLQLPQPLVFFSPFGCQRENIGLRFPEVPWALPRAVPRARWNPLSFMTLMNQVSAGMFFLGESIVISQ